MCGQYEVGQCYSFSFVVPTVGVDFSRHVLAVEPGTLPRPVTGLPLWKSPMSQGLRDNKDRTLVITATGVRWTRRGEGRGDRPENESRGCSRGEGRGDSTRRPTHTSLLVSSDPLEGLQCNDRRVESLFSKSLSLLTQVSLRDPDLHWDGPTASPDRCTDGVRLVAGDSDVGDSTVGSRGTSSLRPTGAGTELDSENSFSRYINN